MDITHRQAVYMTLLDCHHVLRLQVGGGAVPMIPEGKGIRKLTPKECFRLQGWSDDYFEKAQFVNSDTQLYKQAGNGVTVNVIYEIARRLKND